MFSYIKNKLKYKSKNAEENELTITAQKECYNTVTEEEYRDIWLEYLLDIGNIFKQYYYIIFLILTHKFWTLKKFFIDNFFFHYRDLKKYQAPSIMY